MDDRDAVLRRRRALACAARDAGWSFEKIGLYLGVRGRMASILAKRAARRGERASVTRPLENELKEAQLAWLRVQRDDARRRLSRMGGSFTVYDARRRA